MTSYLEDSDRTDSSLPAIGRSRSELRSSRIVELSDHQLGHNHHSHTHSHHFHHHNDDTSRHVRFASHQHSGSTSNLIPRASSPTITCQSRKQILELQDQIRLYKEELARKDDLITKLSEADTPTIRHGEFNYAKIEESFSNERSQALVACRSENAALQVKVDGLNAQLREVKQQLEAREDRIREITLEVETVRENEAKHVAIAHSLRERLNEYESQHGCLEGAAERSEIVICSLKKEKEECNSRILELECTIRRAHEEKEEALQKMIGFESKYHEIVQKLSTVFGISAGSCGSCSSEIISRVTDILHEHASMKEKVATLKEHIHAADLENKASRETILRLVNETEEKKSTASKYTFEMDRMRQEMDGAFSRKRELEVEMVQMKERLEASQNAWAVTRKELEEKERRLSHYSREAQESTMLAHGHDAALRSFKEMLVELLSDSCCKIELSEANIKERIMALLCSLRDKTSHIELLETKLRGFNGEVEKQVEMQRSAEKRAKRVESDYFELESRLRHMESELASEKILRDGLRSDKERYMRFLEQCCEMLKLDIIANDVGLELVAEAILTRCEQLYKLEIDAINNKKTHIYNQQRKIKALKEQLDSRDLHIDLLRKKVAALEERLAGKTELEKEKDTETIKCKKLMKLVEKYKRELQEAHLELRDAKAKLLEGSEFRNRTLEAEGHIECLESKVGQLEEVRVKQAERLTRLKESADAQTENLQGTLGAANQTIQSLTRELKTTKTSLDECSKREKQLLDLRQVFSRMLGLDVNVLAVPDYEIIARLEKLILAHQSSAAATMAIDGAIADMEDGFREGYHKPGTVFVRARSPTRKVTSRVRQRTRTRSLSPQRQKDNRSY